MEICKFLTLSIQYNCLCWQLVVARLQQELQQIQGEKAVAIADTIPAQTELHPKTELHKMMRLVDSNYFALLRPQLTVQYCFLVTIMWFQHAGIRRKRALFCVWLCGLDFSNFYSTRDTRSSQVNSLKNLEFEIYEFMPIKSMIIWVKRVFKLSEIKRGGCGWFLKVPVIRVWFKMATFKAPQEVND